MNDLFNDDDDEMPVDASSPELMTPSRALITAGLDGVNTDGVRKALNASIPVVVVVTVPSSSWARALSYEIRRSHPDASTIVVAERKKDGNEWVVGNMLEKIAAGNHVVICCHDPVGLLPPLVHSSADIGLAMPIPDAALVRRAIRTLTGGAARGLREKDVAGLTMDALLLALRRGTGAADCVRRLRLLTGSKRSPTRAACSLPTLEDLPLPLELATWAHDTAEQLRQVGQGTQPTAGLRFAVLEGAPGVGKTMVAGAIARSAGWVFVSTSVADWFTSSDGHLGGVSKACAAFFDSLRGETGVVGLLDEIDALPDRATLEPRDRQWWSTVITNVLSQIDRVRASGNPVMLLAATNYFDRLDRALVRARRLEQRITVRAPSSETEILAIFAHYLAGEIDTKALTPIAPFAAGATPATIESWVQAARSLARSKGRGLEFGDILAAVVPQNTRGAQEIEAVAVHEAGHAVVAEVLGVGVRSVSVLASGFAGGVTQTLPPPTTINREELEDFVTVYLAGRAADVVMGRKGPHSGASIDLKMATSVLTRGMCEWGLYDTIMHTDPDSSEVFQFIHKSLKRLFNRAVRIVTLHRTAVGDLAAELVGQRLLTGAQVKAVMTKSAASVVELQINSNEPRDASSSQTRRKAPTSRRGSSVK